MIRSIALLSLCAAAASSQVRISQIYGGGGNSGATYTNDFIEIFNSGATPALLAGWSVQYASSTGTSWQKTDIPNVTLLPGQYFLIQESQGAGGTTRLPAPDVPDGTILMSATAGKIALVSNQTAIANAACPGIANGVVDLAGYGTGTNCFEGNAPTPAPSNATAVLRLGNGCQDTGQNGDDFAVGPPNPRNSSSPVNACSSGASPTATATVTPNPVTAGAGVTLSVTVTLGTSPVSTGLRVSCDLSRIGGAAGQALESRDGAVFSTTWTVPVLTLPAAYTIACQVSDAQSRTGAASVNLTVEPPPPIPARISAINGTGTSSPLVSTSVTVRGIVTALRPNSGGSRGFYLQSLAADDDGDPATSEGLLVFTGGTAPPDCAVRGNVIEISGIVQDFVSSAAPAGSVPLTELSNPRACTVLSRDATLPAPLTIAGGTIDAAGSPVQARRWLGMRVRIPQAIVVAPSLGSLNEVTATATPSGVFFVQSGGFSTAFRDAGILATRRPADTADTVPSWSGRPDILRVNTNGLAGGTALELESGVSIADLAGVMDFNTSEGQFQINTDKEGAGTLTSTPLVQSASPVPASAPGELTVGNFNIARFYNDQDENNGAGAVLTRDAYRGRLRKLSLAIRNVMRSPDVLALEEVEAPRTGSAAPQYPVIQDIANQVNSDAVAAGQPDPNYGWCMFPTNDPGAIGVAVLYKKDKISGAECTQFGAATRYTEPGNTIALLNDRPPLVFRGTATAPGSKIPFVFRVVVNHLRSLSGLDQPGLENGDRIRTKRNEQAKYLAALINGQLAEQTSNWQATEYLIVIGDFNAYSYSDGYVDVMGCITGMPARPDQQYFTAAQLAVTTPCAEGSGSPLLDLPLFDRPTPLLNTYTFSGVGGALDHIVLNGLILGRFSGIMVARNNAWFPEGPAYRNDFTRPERVSDHDMPVLYLKLP